MNHKTKSMDITIEEIQSSSIDRQPYQVVAYSTAEGIVVVVREWPSVEMNE